MDPHPPLLKTRATLRPKAQVKPAAPIAIAPAEAEPEERSGTSDKGDAGGGAALAEQDRTAEPRAFLEAKEAALASADPVRHEKDARDGEEPDTTRNTATDIQNERQTDTVDRPVSPDNRFDVSPDDDLYAEVQRLAVMHICPHIADEVQDITMAVSKIVRG